MNLYLTTLSLAVFFVVIISSPVRSGPIVDELVVRSSGIDKRTSFVTGKNGRPISVQIQGKTSNFKARDFFSSHGNLFGITDPASELVQARIDVDELGYTHTRFLQKHEGITVFTGELIVHQNVQGEFVVVNGDFLPIPKKLSTQWRINLRTAKRIALATKLANNRIPGKTDLVIVDPNWYGDLSRGTRLAYYIELVDPRSGVSNAVFVDAHNGAVLDRWSLDHRSIDRRVYDGGGGSALPGLLVRDELSGPAVSPQDADRLFDYLGDTYDYFERAFGRLSIDGADMALAGTVNSTAVACANAFWSSSIREVVFCLDTVSDDIVAHEVTHGITSLTAGLIYQNQSGQLNESFSDVFGELVDMFNGNVAFPGAPSGPPFWPTHPTGPGLDTPNLSRSSCSLEPSYINGVRWLIAEDSIAFGGAIRDMWRPDCEGDPSSASSILQSCNVFDNGGVHSGSGVEI